MIARRTDKKKRGFRGTVTRNAAKQSREVRYAHLKLPKGITMFREEPKTRTRLDILPYEVKDNNHPDRDDEYEIALPGNLWYKRPYWVHRNIGPTNATVVCPSSAKQRCPICEHRVQMLREGADWNDDAVRALKSSMRNLYIVIPRGNKEYEEKPHIWDVSQFLFQDKLNEEVQENENYETFPDLEEGFTLQIRFSEGQLGTNKFAEASRIDFTPRPAIPESILSDLISLDDVLEVPNREIVEALFFGGLAKGEVLDDEDESEAEESYPDVSRTNRRAQTVSDQKQRRLRDDADEEEEDEEEEDEASEEEEGEDEEEEKEETTPAGPPSKGKRLPTTTTDKTKPLRNKIESQNTQCPHNHVFGADCDEYDECESCVRWDACFAAT